MKPTAAKGSFPYRHRTVAEVWAKSSDFAIAQLEEIGRQRALTEDESLRLERVLRRLAA